MAPLGYPQVRLAGLDFPGERRKQVSGPLYVEVGIPLMKSGVKCPSWRDPQPPRGRHQEEGGVRVGDLAYPHDLNVPRPGVWLRIEA